MASITGKPDGGAVIRIGYVAAAAVLVLTGYVALDAVDVVPGVLTGDLSRERIPPAFGEHGRDAEPGPAGTGGPAPDSPDVAAAVRPPLPELAPDAPAPASGPLARELDPLLADPALGPSVGLDVRDGVAGTPLLSVRADVPRRPASTAKLLTAAAVADATDLSGRFVTRVVRGGPGEVVLVAGGDNLLARGRGRPDEVVGRAGLADLASATAAALRGDGVTSVRLRFDESLAPGPSLAPDWAPGDVAAGLTGPVAMLGLGSDRAVPGRAASPDPALAAARAFRAALVAAGVDVAPDIMRGPAAESDAAVEPGAESGPVPASGSAMWAGSAAPDRASAEVASVASAPVADVLVLALQESDNDLTESLARWACAQHGVAPTFAACADWVTRRVIALGVPAAGLRLVDTSGLSDGSAVPVSAIADVLALAGTGRAPGLARVVAGLPVAGLEGTLFDRYLIGPQRAGAGVVRAKTGTLTGVGGLAGTVVDTSGRLLVYAVTADRVPATGTLAARAALDRLVTGLAGCGCGATGPDPVPSPTDRGP